jgi:hypothetical protein
MNLTVEEIMVKQRMIVATTHVDRHFVQITKEALANSAEQINSGSRIVLTVEHDITIPPFGKGLKAWVESRDDGEHQLVLENEWFDDILWTDCGDGTRLFKQESESDRLPFTDVYSNLPNDAFISYDMVNFNHGRDVEAFLNEIRSQSAIEFSTSMFGRKSLIPDPELLIGISKTIGAYLIARSVLEKAGEKTLALASEDIARFYTFIRSVVITALKYARPRNRPVTYVFVARGEPTLEFVARSSDPDLVIGAMTIEKLEVALGQAHFYHSSLGALKIQYLLADDGQWKFNYLLTNTGAVIGTEESLSRRAKRFELLTKENKSIETTEGPEQPND